MPCCQGKRAAEVGRAFAGGQRMSENVSAATVMLAFVANACTVLRASPADTNSAECALSPAIACRFAHTRASSCRHSCSRSAWITDSTVAPRARNGAAKARASSTRSSINTSAMWRDNGAWTGVAPQVAALCVLPIGADASVATATHPCRNKRLSASTTGLAFMPSARCSRSCIGSDEDFIECCRDACRRRHDRGLPRCTAREPAARYPSASVCVE